ncbi:MdlB ABC-type multidrug transport system, ATPase and permease components [Acidimicrobiia bacterium]
MAERVPGIFRRGARILSRYIRANPLAFSLSVLGAAIYAAAAVGTTVIIGRVTNTVIIPTFESGRVERGMVISAGIAILAVGLVRASTIILRRYFAAMVAFRTQRNWRRQLVATYLEVPLKYHRETPTGTLLAHADSDIVAASEVLNPLPFSIGVVTLVVFAIINLAMVDWLLMMIALLLFPGLIIINRLYTRRAELPLGDVQRRVGQVSRVAHESFDGALVVKTLGREQDEVDRLAVAADSLRESRVTLGRIRGTFEPLIEALPNLGIIALLLIGSWLVSVGRLNTGQVVQAAALFGLLAFPMRVFGYFLQELPRSVVASARLDVVIAAEREALATGGVPVLPDTPLAVRFRDVTCRHGEDPPVLEHLDLEIPAGKVVALVGATGAGKSTLCELLPRLVDPEIGVVTLGGIDLRELDPAEVRDAVALVFQETFLFNESVRENVTLGEPVSDERLLEAASIAHSIDFIRALPDGWDTEIGERGITLSGGQRQRLALTRALLRRPRVLVLDDATSAVDPVIEAAILRDLRSSLATSTLVVAHRISTIELADEVAFLDGGTIVARGSHAELLSSSPDYVRLVQAYNDRSAGEIS